MLIIIIHLQFHPLNRQRDLAELKKQAARSPAAPRKKEIAMPDGGEQKEVAATNSMTTG